MHQNLQIHNQNDENSTPFRWVRPTYNSLKVNVDAVVFTDCGSFGASILIRDHNGFFVKAKSVAQSGKSKPREAEARALMKALLWITQL